MLQKCHEALPLKEPKKMPWCYARVTPKLHLEGTTNEKTPPRVKPGRVGKILQRGGSAFAGDLADHLTTTVVAAARAGDMSWDGGAAFRAALEGGCLPAVCALTHALAALGLSALRIGHESIEVGSVLV